MYKRVLVVLDREQASRRALCRAIDFAEQGGSELFVMAVDPGLPHYTSFVYAMIPESVAMLEKDLHEGVDAMLAEAKHLAEEHRVQIHARVCCGDTVKNVVEAVHCAKADVLVFGVRPDSQWVPRLMGGSEHQMIHVVGCDVLGVH